MNNIKQIIETKNINTYDKILKISDELEKLNNLSNEWKKLRYKLRDYISDCHTFSYKSKRILYELQIKK